VSARKCGQVFGMYSIFTLGTIVPRFPSYVFDTLEQFRLISEGRLQLYSEERPHRVLAAAEAARLQFSTVYLMGTTTPHAPPPAIRRFSE